MSQEDVELVRRLLDQYNETGEPPWELFDPEVEWVSEAGLTVERSFRPWYLLFPIVLTFPIGLLFLLLKRTYSVTVSVIPEADGARLTAVGVGPDKLAKFVEGAVIQVAEAANAPKTQRGSLRSCPGPQPGRFGPAFGRTCSLGRVKGATVSNETYDDCLK